MNFRRKDTPSVAAAKASFSTATAYRIESDPQPPSQKQTPRSSRRSDPLDGIFEERSGAVAGRVPGSARGDHLRRTAPPRSGAPCQPCAAPLSAACAGGAPCMGPNREVIFAQKNPPGRLGLSDFTATGHLGVTIGGVPLTHLLYHFRLPLLGLRIR